MDAVPLGKMINALTDKKFPGCSCDESYDEHTCPFAEEINGNYDLCTCCDVCTYECAMDI